MTGMLRVACLLGLLVVPAVAATDPAVQCCEAKLRASAPRELQVLKCHAKAATRGRVVDPGCLADARATLARTFTRIERRGGCAGIEDADRVHADIERITAGIAAALRPVPAASACAARKLRELGRLASSALRIFAEAATMPGTDPFGQAAALAANVGVEFARLEARGGCLTTDDAYHVTALLLTGTHGPVPPEGVILTVQRLCASCGDGIRGGAEECDLFESQACGGGTCLLDCHCPSCGDGAVNRPGETCDGADAAACEGLCQNDCTCPTPTCGNDVKEPGEECDGTALGACGSSCEPDCTCGPAVCGNGIVEEGEGCDGTTCTDPSGILDCSSPDRPGGCRCCDGGFCPLYGCCDSRDVCLPGFNETGICFTSQCTADHPCRSGYLCATSPSNPTAPGLCVATVGEVCGFLGRLIAPCLPPSVCPNLSLGRCTLP
ncbi:MAG TPA: hypothetical protein VGR62_13805 [Candidatus Binatia bacterium]|jgi:hypothetical protein|nr:hypothetical protein [Candidatus Binatia bacterium]